MIDRELVTSGFDTETLVSEAYLSYLLLAQIEAGFHGAGGKRCQLGINERPGDNGGDGKEQRTEEEWTKTKIEQRYAG